MMMNGRQTSSPVLWDSMYCINDSRRTWARYLLLMIWDYFVGLLQLQRERLHYCRPPAWEHNGWVARITAVHMIRVIVECEYSIIVLVQVPVVGMGNLISTWYRVIQSLFLLVLLSIVSISLVTRTTGRPAIFAIAAADGSWSVIPFE